MSVHGPPLSATPQSGGFELTTRSLDSRAARSSARTGLIGLFGLLACGLVVSISAARTDSLLPESIRPAPASLAGAFGTSGADVHVLGAVALLLLMFVAYVLAVNAADRLSPRAVLMTIAALYAVVLLAPPLFSTDIFSYQAYGRMGALYGANPYVQGPHAIMLDPLFPYVGAKWSYIPSAYGPVFTTLSYALAPLSVAASVLAYKSIAAVAGLVLVALVWNAARLRGLNPVKAVALVGLNPLLVLYGIGAGHNDLLMLVALMAGIYLTIAHRERLGGGMLVLGIGIKLTAGLLLPFAIAGGGRQGARGVRRRLATGAGMAAAVVAALSFGLYGTGVLNLISTVQRSQSEGDWHSIPGFLASSLGGTAGHIAGYVLAAAFVGITLWLLRRVWRGQIDWIDGAAWATVAMLITASSLLPWYVAWLLPLAALGTDRRLFRVAIVMTGVIQGIQLLGYIPHGVALGV